jgi:hypothetical protein
MKMLAVSTKALKTSEYGVRVLTAAEEVDSGCLGLIRKELTVDKNVKEVKRHENVRNGACREAEAESVEHY